MCYIPKKNKRAMAIVKLRRQLTKQSLNIWHKPIILTERNGKIDLTESLKGPKQIVNI